MADNKKNIFQRLRGLFSSNVIVRNVGGKKIKTVDFNKLQYGTKKTNFMIDRYSRLHSTGKSTGYPIGQDSQTHRMSLFQDYEEMDNDPIIASALDIYSDESTMKNEFGNVLTITTDNSKIHDVLHNLFYDVLNIEFNLWPWVRNMVKYGDFFLKLDIADEIGVVNVNPLAPYEVAREEGYDESNPNQVRFRIEGATGGYGGGGTPELNYLENYEMAHFRLLSDSNFVPYGKSMIESARKTWKQLALMEDAMLVHRIMRAPEKRIFKIDIGNIPPNEVDNYMQQIINKSKKVPLVDSKTGQYNLKYNMQNITEDFYVPVRGGDSGTSIDSLPGLTYEATEDIEYLRNKMMAALKIPKAFLGYDETTEGKATLAAEDVRFARTVERIQRIVVSELTKIAVVHLYTQGFTDSDLVNFSMNLTNSSTIYEQEKIELWNNKVGVASSMISDRMMSSDWIYQNIFNMDDDQIEKVRAGIIDDRKRIFRWEQIEQEGNDPFKTGQSFGTAHDLAAMNLEGGDEEQQGGGKNPFGEDFDIPDDGWEGSGRPEEGPKYGKDSSVRGRDPLGKDRKNAPINLSPKHSYKGGTPLASEIHDLKNNVKVKSRSILKESLIKEEKNDKKVDNQDDKNTILDEKNIKDIK